jgi:hypothetical protein
MVVRANHVVAGRDVLGLSLKEGQLPDGLQVGDHIDIYDVSDANNSCPGSPGSTLAGNAIVIAIATPSVGSGSSAQANVQVALDPRDAGPVACNASNGIVGVAVLIMATWVGQWRITVTAAGQWRPVGGPGRPAVRGGFGFAASVGHEDWLSRWP